MRTLLIIFISPFLLNAQLPELIPYKKGKLWGYADSTGRIVIEPQWTGVTLFDTNGLARVLKEFDHEKKWRYKGKRYQRIEECSYEQIINKKGEYIIPHERIMELLLKYHVNSFNCFDLTIHDSLITLWNEEAGLMQFDLQGRLLFVTCEGSSRYTVTTYAHELNRRVLTYAYALNRQLVYDKEGLHFADRYLNPKSRKYSKIYEEDWTFDSYYLYKMHNEDGTDSVVNPDGPAALVKHGKYWMFVDTNDLVLYKWKDKGAIPDIGCYRHPKDTLRYNRRTYVEYKPYPGPYSPPVNPYSWFDTGKAVFARWFSRGVLPSLYDARSTYVHDLKLPYMLVKSDSFYSYMDTLGNLTMPFKYKKLTHYRGYYALAFDTAWHCIDINGMLLSSNQYKNVEIYDYPNLHNIGYDTAWHWIDGSGNIIYEEYCRKGYQVVPFTGMTLFLDPRRGLYIDKYGREYGE